jgi:fatty acid desaturase
VLPIIVTQVAVALAAGAVGDWETYLLLWLAPLVTVMLCCYRIRGLSDHYGIVPTSERYAGRLEDPFGITRSLVPASLVGFVIGSYGVGYHLEHHLYPTVPVYRLGKVHRMLMKHADFRARAHITRGHLELFRELTGGGRSGASLGPARCPNRGA